MSDYLFSVFPSENFVDLGLFQFGREKCSPGHSFGPAARNHFLFHYVISGKGVLNIHEKDGTLTSHPVKSMQGFMIFPDQITTYIADAETPWEYVWVEFDGLRVRGLLKSAGITEKEPVYR
ncbi:MAG: AraC family ligand binding domain-containing protein, partial [Oscillospiraceae bacterium]|nr:AraC family ligand binding domain-containing protein [Oscillospiraceae bacterium]